MTLEITLATLFTSVFACLVARLLSQRTDRKSRSLVQIFGLFSGTGVLMAMGSIEMAGRYGYSAIVALVGFTLIFVFSPLIFTPIRRLNEIMRFATPVDFLTFRYRHKTVAAVSSISLILAATPLILTQFLAVESVFEYILGDPLSSGNIKPVVLTLTAATIILTSLRSIQIGSTKHLGWMMTAAGLLLLPALGLCAWISVQSAFGGIAEMNDWVMHSGQRLVIQRLDSSYSLFVIFLAASFANPINFTSLVSDNTSDRQVGTAAWAYPLLVLLACIPVFPILWSGIFAQSSSPLQEYLYALPALAQYPIIAGLGCASILLLAIALTGSLSLIASKICLNSFVLPSRALQQQTHLSRWIKQRQILLATCLILVCAGLTLVTKGRSITDYYLAGFSGLAQLTPGMLAVIYIPQVNRQGFIAGLITGIIFWLITIAIPLLFGDWQWQLPLTDTTIYFGMQNWSIWAIEALLLNIIICTVFSVYSHTDKEQESFATICMADNVYIPARVEIVQKSVAELTKSLRLSLGDAADMEIERALHSLGFSSDEIRPAALRQLRDHINASLNLHYGVLAADRMMRQSLPLNMPFTKEPDDIYLIESVLAIHGDRLTGIASELNKLRVHHRQILDNLPIGVVSLDQSGEILKWNATVATYTNISGKAAIGSSVTDLPQPWKSTISQFVQSSENSLDNVRIELDGRVRWFSLQKSVDQGKIDTANREYNNEYILLIEEQTQAVVLKQTSIDNERLASVGRLAAGVAHEIGNPITGIACLAQNLHYETEADQIAESARQILSQTQRVNRIIESLIAFSRGDDAPTSSQRQISLKNAAEEAIHLLSLSNREADVEFRCNIDEKLVIFSDYHQLIQIFLNLLSNARDASSHGDHINIDAMIEQQHIKVTISDWGCGVDENIRAQLFEPFVTSKDSGKGTGLGLWVVFNLIKSLGATMTLSSPAENSDCGTTVTLHFPLSSPL